LRSSGQAHHGDEAGCGDVHLDLLRLAIEEVGKRDRD
jgi:hypothetical protein